MRLLPLLLLLAACAATPPAGPPPEPPLPYPPETRERLLRLALGEWREWGCVARGLPGPALAPGCGAEAAVAPPPAREGDSRSFSRVLAYWRSVPQEGTAIPPNRARYLRALAGDPGAALWAEPYWSAAFVSWLFSAAGVDRAEFAGDASHAAYLDHLDRLAAFHPALTPLLPREVWERAPEPGDLLCFDRSSRPLATWAERRAEAGRFRPMHCDLVVATGPGVVEAVGGNVGDAVSLTRLPADASGRPLPPPDGRPTLVVVENRIGRLPPFAAPPAVVALARPPRG